MKICAIDGCGLKSHSRGWCKGHYARWRRHGNPVAGEPLPEHRQPAPGTLSALQGFIAARNKRLAKLNRTGIMQ